MAIMTGWQQYLVTVREFLNDCRIKDSTGAGGSRSSELIIKIGIARVPVGLGREALVRS